MRIIGPFDGEYEFLSAFARARVQWEGAEYPTLAHAFQAAKTLNVEEREAIQRARTPASAKRLGKKVDLRPDWESMKVEIMEALVRQKFQDPTLRDKLIATGNEILQEANTWNDQFWGVSGGRGKNHLGKILMKVRRELQEAGPARSGVL